MSRLTRTAFAVGLALLVLAVAPGGALARGSSPRAAARPTRHDAAALPTVSPPDTTTGVFRPINGNLCLKLANITGTADITPDYGLPGDMLVTGDWTGKGYNSVGVFRSGRFPLRDSNTTGPSDHSFLLGVAGDEPIAGPWIAGVSDVSITTPSPNPYTFSPASLTIPSGTEVIWTNTTGVPHTATSNAGDPVAFDSGTKLFAQNATFAVIFITAGTYSYHCNIHAFMIASITVTAAP